MSQIAFRGGIHLSKLAFNNKLSFSRSLSKSLTFTNLVNTRAPTRSLFVLSKNREAGVRDVSSRVLWSNKCSCKCGIHTKGDQELTAFLAEEIENEKKNHMEPTKLEGYECKLEGSEVTFTRKQDDELITIRSNVNNSVDAEDSVMDPNEEAKEQPQESEMKAKPEFTVEILKGKKTLSFVCSYSQEITEEEGQSYNDSFQISEVSLFEGEFTDSTYSVSGEIMDGYLYDLLMNYLEERGISNEFADKMITFFTSYEHKLYINLLQGMKSFVEK